MNFCTLSKMRRPSSTALRILAKLSSLNTISAADLATSLPPRPMAIPTSARFREGESFTPSPVMATNFPRRCSASIMRTFVLGAQRATTNGNSGRPSTCSSERESNSPAVMTSPFAISCRSKSIRAGRMPTSSAIALAVSGWSPVSMWTAIPARWHLNTLARDSGRGGS